MRFATHYFAALCRDALCRKICLLSVPLACLLILSPQAHAGLTSVTTTTLSFSSSSVTAGTAVTLTATVTGNPISPTNGQVIFCNAGAAHCDGAAVFGVAQVTSTNTAIIKLRLGVGTYSIKAVFEGTVAGGGGFTASTSAAQSVTVTAISSFVSATQIAASGSVGNYTLTGTVAVFGNPAPTGTVSFLDTSNGNATVGSAALSAATLASIFGPAPPITGQRALFAAGGDFRNRGITDLAIVISGNKVLVVPGNGDGTFNLAASASYPVGTNPEMLAVADVNNDGYPDLIVPNFGNGTVTVLLGSSAGTFSQPLGSPFSTGTVSSAPIYVAVGDFDGDGNPDLAVVNLGDQTVSILFGNGDGTFGAPSAHAVGNGAHGVAIGDFNQDGAPDLAVTNSSDGTVSILLNTDDGTGGFAAQQVVTLPASSSPNWLVSGDLRNTGASDLVVADSGHARVFVLLSNGTGTFQAAVTYAVQNVPTGAFLGDVNRDGILDLVVPDTGADGVVSVFVGNGNGTFATRTDYTITQNGPAAAVLADFNGDGLLDIATSNQDQTVTILLQAQTETATATGIAVFPTGTHNVLASYPGDSDRLASQSPTTPLTGSSPATTTTTLTVSPNPATAGQSVTLTATVSPIPTGSSLGVVAFCSGGVAPVVVHARGRALLGADVSRSSTSPADGLFNPCNAGGLLGSGTVNSSGVATLVITTLPAGSDSITAVYSGNAAFAESTSTAVTETVNATFTVTAPPAPVMAAEGGSANVTVTVPPVGGSYNNVVTLSASGEPPHSTVTFTPDQVTPGSAGGTTTMTVQLAHPAAIPPASPQRMLPLALLGLLFAASCFFYGYKRSKVFRLAFAAVILAEATMIFAGCQGGFSGGPGTPPGNYVITVTGTSGSQQASTTVTLVVQ
jgi:FG-GAP-like repeat/Bacterial Ig-like domain (group 3)